VHELGTAVVEGTHHERPWPEVWGFSSGMKRSDVQNFWESGESKA